MLIPVLDAALLVAITYFLPQVTILLVALGVVLTALVGTLLVRAEGRRTIRKIRRAVVEEGRAPTDELLDGALLIASGAFLLTPGFVTDAVGFLLVLPPTRIPIRMAVKKFVVVPYLEGQTDGFTTGEVYTFGFPGPDGGASATGADGGDGGDTVDIDEDAYDIEFEDENEG